MLVNELARPALALNLPCEAPCGQVARPGEPVYFSLRTLVRTPPALDVRDRPVFVCENPNIVAITADRLGADAAPLVCTEGMPAAAQRTLLAQLTSLGARLRYHGDFDWPGLQIANHVLRQFGAVPWRMSASDYKAAVAASAERQPLRGRPIVATWDTALTVAMRHFGGLVPEEAVTEALIADLRH